MLVVEDRDDVRHGMAQLLELHGFLGAPARDGEEAIEQLTVEPHGFALIPLDLLLPGRVSGRDFRMRQLADPALAAIPTIVVTTSMSIRRSARRYGPTAGSKSRSGAHAGLFRGRGVSVLRNRARPEEFSPCGRRPELHDADAKCCDTGRPRQGIAFVTVSYCATCFTRSGWHDL
ncbi:MAG: hypothetical protein HYY76_03650 [Acidobacteria bacterium]|nr:hypothetical protein [Acidobacteriota bacterium]